MAAVPLWGRSAWVRCLQKSRAKGVEVVYETDFFGTSLSLIRREETSGEERTFDLLGDSRTEVHRKAVPENSCFTGEWKPREASSSNASEP